MTVKKLIEMLRLFTQDSEVITIDVFNDETDEIEVRPNGKKSVFLIGRRKKLQ